MKKRLIELFIIHDMKSINQNYSSGSNPLRPPLDRGREKLAPPLSRGGWEGFESVMIYGNINRQNPKQKSESAIPARYYLLMMRNDPKNRS